MRGSTEREKEGSHPSRIEHPPPVPVTQPRFQNLAHNEGMRFAGWLSSSEMTRWWLFSKSCMVCLVLDRAVTR